MIDQQHVLESKTITWGLGRYRLHSKQVDILHHSQKKNNQNSLRADFATNDMKKIM